MQEEPKRHHFVPEMLQKRFLDERGRLHIYNRYNPELGIVPKIPRQNFVKTHLYSTENNDGSKNTAFEHFLSELEYKADNVIEKIVLSARNNIEPNLTNEERSVWHEFLLMQWKRVPDLHKTITTYEELERLIDTELDTICRIAPHRANEAELLRRKIAKRRLMKNIRVGVYANNGNEVMDILRNRGMAILRIDVPRKSFVICSRPVVKLTVNGKSDLRDTESELWLPVSSDIAVGVGDGISQEKLLLMRDEKPIRQLNIAGVGQSSMFGAASPHLVKSLILPK